MKSRGGGGRLPKSGVSGGGGGAYWEGFFENISPVIA